MAPTALAILTTTFPDGAERNKGAGHLVGDGRVWRHGRPADRREPPTTLGWEWIFYLNLPVASACSGSARSCYARALPVPTTPPGR
jgi:hypothetical protein